MTPPLPPPATTDGSSPDRDHRLDSQLGRLLSLCTGIASLVILAGVGALVARHSAEHADFQRFSADFVTLKSPRDIAQGLAAGNAAAIAQAGLVLLMLTPVIRVAATLVAFAIRRDRVFVAITLVVLVTLLLGIAGVVA